MKNEPSLFFRTLFTVVFSLILISSAPAATNSPNSMKNTLKVHGVGVDSSGGGNAVVCRDQAGAITSAKLLDLAEAEVIDALVISPRIGISEQIAEVEIMRLKSLNEMAFSETTVPAIPALTSIFTDILKNIRILPTGVTLAPIPDSFSPIAFKNCAVEQLAAYQPTGQLLIVGDIWNALDVTQRAALYVHEAIYKRLRFVGSTDSVRARKIVGALFGNASLEPVHTARDLKDWEFCWDKADEHQVEFVKGRGPDGLLQYHFLTLNHQPVVSGRIATGVKEYLLRGGDKWMAGVTQSKFEGSEKFEERILSRTDHSGKPTVEHVLVVRDTFGIDGKDLKYEISCAKPLNVAATP